MRCHKYALGCREKKNKPLKNPLKELVVVHTDKEFLADIEGKPYPLLNAY